MPGRWLGQDLLQRIGSPPALDVPTVTGHPTGPLGGSPLPPELKDNYTTLIFIHPPIHPSVTFTEHVLCHLGKP